jgi:hypothetical protein
MNRPLLNPDAEALAIALANAKDGAERRKASRNFLALHPDLKRWEGMAIVDRASYLKKQFDNPPATE